jgi:SAM-dependent methyltransferase
MKSARPFAGTAEYYLEFRVPYPEALLAELRSRAGVRGGVLLDLGCGPGRLTLPLAPHFDSVIAADVEPEMIAVGANAAAARGVTNIRWIVARAESLDIEPASVDLVTIGEAFHRMDQRVIASRVMRWLKPRACVATLGQTHDIWVGTAEWQRVLAALVAKWSRDVRSISPDVVPSTQHERDEVLRRAGFAIDDFQRAVVLEWTLDSLLGHLYSMSMLSKAALGADVDQFDAEVRHELTAIEPRGRFAHTLAFGCTLARRTEES